MSRAQTKLTDFRDKKQAELGASGSERRPRMASTVTDLRAAERWRTDVMRDISRKMSRIQDESLTNYEIRDLNDEINKLLRQKAHWETRIIHLGGANYKRASRYIDASGKEVPGNRGYKYFGRARELPGVKELFEAKDREDEELEDVKKLQAFQMKQMGPEYYGDFDEVDGKILELERLAQIKAWRDGGGLDENLPRELSARQKPILPPGVEITIPKDSQEPSAKRKKGKKAEAPITIAEPEIAFTIKVREPILPSNDEIDAHVAALKKAQLESL